MKVFLTLKRRFLIKITSYLSVNYASKLAENVGQNDGPASCDCSRIYLSNELFGGPLSPDLIFRERNQISSR